MKEWNKNITIPNLLSVLRILLILPFVYFFMTGNVLLAGLMLALSGLSDLFDGMIARKFNQVTDLGKMLDPVADKLTQGTVAICLAIWEPVLLPILAIFIVKELAMLAGGIYLVLKEKNGQQLQNGMERSARLCFIFPLPPLWLCAFLILTTWP